MLKNEDTFYRPPLESRSRARTISLSYFPKLSNGRLLILKIHSLDIYFNLELILNRLPVCIVFYKN